MQKERWGLAFSVVIVLVLVLFLGFVDHDHDHDHDHEHDYEKKGRVAVVLWRSATIIGTHCARSSTG